MTRSKFFAVMVVLAMAFFSSACDDPPTNPSPLPTPTVTPPAEVEYTFWVLERGSNQPISGATLSTSFGQFQTDESGKVIIRSTTGGFQITVTAESCLPFVTAQRTALTNLLIYCLHAAGNSELTVRQAVFGDIGADFNPGLHPLYRLDGPVSIVLEQRFIEEWPNSASLIYTWAQKLQNQIGFQVYASTSAVPGTAVFPLRIDQTIEDKGFEAIVTWDIINYRIVGGGIAFSRSQLYDLVVGHEFGHVFGLSHHNAPGLLNLRATPPWEYSANEVENIKLMLTWKPGTTWPLSDASSGILTRSRFSGKQMVTIGCRQTSRGIVDEVMTYSHK